VEHILSSIPVICLDLEMKKESHVMNAELDGILEHGPVNTKTSVGYVGMDGKYVTDLYGSFVWFFSVRTYPQYIHS